ncbi:PREDICTED: cyclin-H [Papilio polytes]|uniref:cyclin-H n=1 Tax=Papilio polytes TaxID=76194 RepID=UPI000675D655|nr:PREDICTED: cyclin-H [Papilio polytes]
MFSTSSQRKFWTFSDENELGRHREKHNLNFISKHGQHIDEYQRPVEGFLIDIKTRCNLANPERLRTGIDEFLEKVFLTDACLLYAPSQIALAAVLHAASKEQENLDSYVTDMLFRDAGPDKLAILIEAVRKIRSMVKMVESPARERVRVIEKKLDRCRNQENNPDSEIYKRRVREALDEDDIPHGAGRMSLDTSGVSQMLSPSAS